MNQDLEKAVENLGFEEQGESPILLTYLKLAILPEVLAIIPTDLEWNWIHIKRNVANKKGQRPKSLACDRLEVICVYTNLELH